MDYEGNRIDSGDCGYPMSTDASTLHPHYYDNGNWVDTTCVCPSIEYPSCESLGFTGSCMKWMERGGLCGCS